MHTALDIIIIDIQHLPFVFCSGTCDNSSFLYEFMQVYKKMSVLITESLFFINLILLVGGLMYFSDESHEFERIILFSVSTYLVFVKFCGIILWSMIRTYCSKRRLCRRKYTSIEEEHQVGNMRRTQSHVHYRDSIFSENTLALSLIHI